MPTRWLELHSMDGHRYLLRQDLVVCVCPSVEPTGHCCLYLLSGGAMIARESLGEVEEMLRQPSFD